MIRGNSKIAFGLPVEEHVSIIIYDIAGKEVKSLINNYYGSGLHSIIWDATDQNNKNVSAGMYLYQIKSGDHVEVKKMMLLK